MVARQLTTYIRRRTRSGTPVWVYGVTLAVAETVRRIVLWQLDATEAARTISVVAVVFGVIGGVDGVAAVRRHPHDATRPDASTRGRRRTQPTATAPPSMALAVLCLVQFVLTFDDTAVNVAIAELQADLDVSTARVAWVANAYFVAFGGLLLLGGRLGDLLGRRRAFRIGLGVFGAASLACGLAPSAGTLIASRFLQGAAAAVVSPSALALITLRFPHPGQRSRAFGVWGAVAGAGGISGLVLAGLLIDAGSWRWIFLVNPPLALAVIALTPRLTKESRDPSDPALDTKGAAVGTLAVMALIYGLLRAADHGWADPATFLPIASTLVLIPVFVWIERRTADPLVPLAFVAFPPRLVANVVNVVFAGAFFALSFLTMLHLQRDIGLTPLRAAVAYLPHGLALLSGVALSSWCANRVGVRTTLIAALLTAVAGMLLLGLSTGGTADATELLPGLVVTGVASGLGFPLLAVSALAGTDETDAGLGSAVLGSSQQLGGALGLAALVNVASGTPRGISTAMFAVAGVLGAAALIATALPEPRKEIP